MQYRVGGVTLPELLVVIVILLLLFALAVPAWQRTVQSHRAWSEVNSLHSALQLARETAISRGHHAVLCRTDTSGHCTVEAGSWSDGWKVFEALDGQTSCLAMDGAQCQHGGALIHVRHGGANAAHGQLSHNHNIRHYVRFDPQGMAGNHNGTFTWCGADNRAEYGLVILRTGRVRAASPADLLPCASDNPD
ncbi:type IV fimbrial biogenesis protein FimT [Natronocella acetinitrilica]|uniref:Type II secretion system protein H n=1 Tax=Natronocella acetinitrilica TaxID=414046 RepID=A0AAE3KDB0_9GAMM|nr:GspH/FimT family protein [Natronocella acetinitrilica]MCP1676626.1 type IV fimbrial biogenesis protein FimT [Natronocella acetinitrilica]